MCKISVSVQAAKEIQQYCERILSECHTIYQGCIFLPKIRYFFPTPFFKNYIFSTKYSENFPFFPPLPRIFAFFLSKSSYFFPRVPASTTFSTKVVKKSRFQDYYQVFNYVGVYTVIYTIKIEKCL